MSDPTSTIFDGGTPPAEPTQTPQPAPAQENTPAPSASDAYATMLGSIKSDDGRVKYATVSDALSSIPHAQSHINSIEEENARLKEELAKRASVEEALAQLANKPEPVEPPSPSGPQEQDISALIDQRLDQRTAAQKAQDNQTAVVTKLGELYGDNAEAEYIRIAGELGVDVGFLNDMAASAPLAVLKYFDEKPAAPRPTTEGSVNTEAFSQRPQNPQEHKSVMFGASTDDLIGAWRRHKPEE